MHGVNLPDKLPGTGMSWKEEIPSGSVSRFSASFGSDSGVISLPIVINGTWRNIRSAIKQIIGYSYVTPTFDKNNASAQGPYTLKRVLPARHPALAGLRATKILGVVGGGTRDSSVGVIKAVRPLNAPADESYGMEGTYGQYQYVWLNIQFEIPRYPILSDAERDSAGIATTNAPEYKRFHEFLPQDSLETLARKGEVWAFCLGNNIVGQKTFAGDRLLRQPKTNLKVIGHDIHQDYVMLGRLVASNYHHRLGTVNSRAFPQSGYRDQNKAGSIVVQHGPGTCLLLPEKITMSAQNHPAVMTNEISPDYFPRTCTVETNILVFDPPSSDTTTVNLSGNDVYGFPMSGSPITPIRGHQLAPSVMPGTVAPHVGNLWWAAKRAGAGDPPPVPGNPSSDAYLLHRYSDFERLWMAAESMTP